MKDKKLREPSGLDNASPDMASMIGNTPNPMPRWLLVLGLFGWIAWLGFLAAMAVSRLRYSG